MRNSLVVSGVLVGMCFGLQTPSAGAAERHSFESSPMVYRFDYRESCPPPLKSTEESWLMGSRFVYGYRSGEEGVQGRIQFEFTRAGTSYDGTDQAGSPLTGVSVNTFLTGEVDLGYRVANPFGEKSHLLPYAGLGYRHRDRDLDQYTEKFDWRYLPIGVRLEYQPSPQWTAALDFSFRLMLKSGVKVLFSELDPQLNDPKADLGGKTGFKFSLPVAYRIRPQWGVTLAPWYEQIDFGQTATFPITRGGEPIGDGYVPASQTRQYGLNVGVTSFF